MEYVEHWAEGEAQGMGVICSGAAYIVFRGTEPHKIKDWMTDAQARPSHFRNFYSVDAAMVHRGFEAYTLCLENHFNAFAERTDGMPLVICGHSLGGAAAFLCAAMLIDKLPIHRIITFGAPPAGNREFVTAYNLMLGGITRRFENNNDCVPVLPDLAPWLDHVGARYYLPRFGKHVIKNPSWIRRHSDRLLGRLTAATRLHFLAGVHDHDMVYYKSQLEKML